MADYVQTYNYQSSDVPSQVRNIVANKVSLLDQYIVFCTGTYEYVALIRNVPTGDVTAYIFTRGVSGNTYVGYYDCTVVDDAAWNYEVRNEYYVYSNIGVGASLSLPVYAGVSAFANAGIVCALALAIVFKGVLLPCLNGLRKRV